MTDQNRNQNLRDLLERLHSELEQTESVDETGNEMLDHLDRDIRALLQRSGRKKDRDEPVLERLRNLSRSGDETELLPITSRAGNDRNAYAEMARDFMHGFDDKPA